MRVMLLNPSFSGGAYTHRLANALVDAGTDVDLWTAPLHSELSRSWDPVRYRAYERFYRHTQWRSWSRGLTQPVWRLARLVGHEFSFARVLAACRSYDVVHVHFPPVPAVDAYWIRALHRRTAVVYHVHNLYPHDATRTAALRRRLRRIYANCDLLLAHTAETVNALHADFGIPRHRIVRVDHGNFCDLVRETTIPSAESLALARSAPIILMLGDARRNKGIDTLLRAGAKLRRRGLDFRILVVGRNPGGEPKHLVRLAQQLGIADATEFRYWFVPEETVPAYLRAASVVAFPYRAIDQSGGAIWALSYGRPLVASRVGGLASLIEQSSAGLLVPPDQPHALADALAEVLTDKKRSEAMGAVGRTFAKEYLSWEPIARQTVESYHSAISLNLASRSQR